MLTIECIAAIFIFFIVVHRPNVEGENPFKTSARCVGLKPGLLVTGGEYSKVENVKLARACAAKCVVDCGCMAFIYDPTNGDCYLKAKSLNGSVKSAKDQPRLQFGMCTSEYDDSRSQFFEHAFHGTVTLITDSPSDHLCSVDCSAAPPATLYTWQSDGTCTCIAELTGIVVDYRATSGIVQKQQKIQKI